jgi:hypothetical protein
VQFDANLKSILDTSPLLKRNELEQIRQIVQTAKERNVSLEQAAQDLHIKLTRAQQELMTRFSGAVQSAVDAGMLASEARSFLREAIGVSNMATHLSAHGENARAQQILDMYDKGATLTDLHKQMREWGYGDWVKEELARLDSIDYRKLAGMSADFSCADIDTICRETGTRVWLENAGRKVQTTDFVLTIERGAKEGRFKTVREWTDIAKRHEGDVLPSSLSGKKENMFG